jgi:hypothetical protein
MATTPKRAGRLRREHLDVVARLDVGTSEPWAARVPDCVTTID